jgi:hypothetical protein
MRQRVVVQAELEDVYAAARDLDFAHALSSPMIRGLGALRALPVRVAGRLRRRGEAGTAATEMPDDARVVNAPPFIILDEQAGTEIVFGMIGQFMRATKMEFARIRPEEFAPFDRPGFGKVAFNLRVQPYGRGKSLLTSETRTATTDPTSRAQFRRYWCVVGPGADFIMRRLLAALKVDAERRHASR